jgi:hypothetical protein
MATGADTMRKIPIEIELDGMICPKTVVVPDELLADWEWETQKRLNAYIRAQFAEYGYTVGVHLQRYDHPRRG